jgi:uncharacterized protein involved in outer membrane biogenesis
VALGLSGKTVAALSLVPLITVAWADGAIQDNERDAILHGAAGKGMEAGTDGHELLSSWLAKKPDDSLFEAWEGYIKSLLAQLNDEQTRLLKKQVVAKRIFLDEPTVTLIRNRSGHWNVLAGLPSAAKDESAYQMFSRLLQIREATIQQGHITITDEARPDGVRTTKLEAVEMALKVYPGKAQGDLHISASLPAEAAPSSFSLTGTIGLSESSSSLAAEEPYSVHPAFQFDGEIETTNLRLREAADFFGPRPVPAQLQGGANLQSRIRVAPGVAGYDVVLTEIAANVDQLAITGKANMAGLLTSQPTFSITFASPTIDLKTLFARNCPASSNSANWAGRSKSSRPR